MNLSGLRIPNMYSSSSFCLWRGCTLLWLAEQAPQPLRERATCSQLAGMWCACCCRETASFSKKQMRLVWGGGSARCKTCVAAAEAAKREEERRAKQRRLDAAAADVERDASPQRPRLFLADAKSPYLVEVEVPADGVPVGVPYRVAGRTLTLRRDSGPRVWGEVPPPSSTLHVRSVRTQRHCPP